MADRVDGALVPSAHSAHPAPPPDASPMAGARPSLQSLNTSSVPRLYGSTDDQADATARPANFAAAGDCAEALALLVEEELDADTLLDEEAEEEDAVIMRASIGVKTVEATQRLHTSRTKWALFIGLGIATYMHSLDAITTASFPAFAASSFHAHSVLGAIQVTQGVVIAVGKPIIAKLADVSSRGRAYLLVVVCYLIGYIIAGSASNIRSFIVGIILASVASSSLQLLNQILIADLTTLRLRGFIISLSTVSFLFNAPVGAFVSATLLQHGSWRVGYFLFSALMPLFLAPLVGILLWSERRASHMGLVPKLDDSNIYEGLPSQDPFLDTPEPRDGRSSPLSPLTPRGRLSLAGARPPPSPRFSRIHGRPLSGISFASNVGSSSWWIRARRFASALDLPGLVLLAAGVALLLVPLSLSHTPLPSPPQEESIMERGANMLRNARHGALFALGACLIGMFLWWDLRHASSPVIARPFINNKTVIIAAGIGFFDFASFYLTYTFLFSFVLVVKPWSLTEVNTFVQIQGVSMTVLGIFAGAAMGYLRRYKVVLLCGLGVRLIGVLMMLYSRGPEASNTALVVTQVMQGMGGGAAAIALQVGAQASICHGDLAIVTAVVLLLTEIGGAVGGAIASAIWNNFMPAALAQTLPFLSAEKRAELFGSITAAAEYPMGDPVRTGVIEAYDAVMRRMILVAIVFAILPGMLALRLPDWYLADKQHTVEDETQHGRRGRSQSANRLRQGSEA